MKVLAKNRFLWMIVGLFILGSCASSSNLSNGIITKRKYNKGFHISLNKNKKNNLLVKEIGDKEPKKNAFAEKKTQNESKAPKSITDSKNTTSQKNIKENYDFEQHAKKTTISFQKLAELPEKLTDVKNKISDKSSKDYAAPTMDKTNRISENQKQNSNAMSKVEVLLLVIICIFIPPLAVYLFEGSWTKTCTINLILTLLFFIPGLIHGLYVILV